MSRFARPSVALIASLVAGAAAVAVAARWVGEQVQLSTTPVVVAARDLPAGTRLSSEMLSTVAWPAQHRPERSAGSADGLTGRVITAALMRGEPVLDARLAPVGERGGLSALLAPGRRAMTVKVSEVVGVAGFALPGHYVDVMVNTMDAQQRATSKIVLGRILVLAVAQDAATQDNKPRVVNAVTLEVTPAQAERIDLARNVGTISLVLRSQADTDTVATDGVRKDALLGEPAAAATLADTSRFGPKANPRAGLRTAARPSAPPSAGETEPAAARTQSNDAPPPTAVALQADVIRGTQLSTVSMQPSPTATP